MKCFIEVVYLFKGNRSLRSDFVLSPSRMSVSTSKLIFDAGAMKAYKLGSSLNIRTVAYSDNKLCGVNSNNWDEMVEFL